jgi:hypothetical protein
VLVRVNVALDAPQLAPLAHHAVAHDTIPVAQDPRVALEVDLQPLGLEVGLRERALAVQRRLERQDDLGDRRRVSGRGRVGLQPSASSASFTDALSEPRPALK